MSVIYLDHNGTTPMCQEVCEEISSFLTFEDNFPSGFGNASSTHRYGLEAKEKLETARNKVAELFQAERQCVTFTSGGTESNNMVILGLSQANCGKTVVFGPCEHPAIEEPITEAKKIFNIKSRELKATKDGSVDVSDFRASLSPDVFLVTVMLAQNEIGTVNDVDLLWQIIGEYNKRNEASIELHVDASQAVGKIPVRFSGDFMTVAGHKFYGPKGVGVLLQRQKLQQVFTGAGQENGNRPGTENVMLISALGVGCQVAQRKIHADMRECAEMVEELYNQFRSTDLDFLVNGSASILLQNDQFIEEFSAPKQRYPCLPNTLSISFRNVPANSVISAVNDRICISAGAACHSDTVEISETLKVIGLDQRYAIGTLRISCGRFVNKQQCIAAAKIIANTVKQYENQKPIELPELSNHVKDNETQPNNAGFEQVVTAQSENLEEEKCMLEKTTDDLLSLTSGLGCACKLRPQALERIMKDLNFGVDPNVIINESTNDDAAVTILDSNNLITTVDFFSPIIDDPYLYGAISAANSISDIYAMGGKPRVAVAIAGFPSNRMSEESMTEIMKGAIEKCREASIIIAGGHTIESIEPFFGLAVNGIIANVRDVKRNVIPVELCNNDIYLVLTKKLGVGILTTALKRGVLQKRPDYKEVYSELVHNMIALNTYTDHPNIIAMTDVTGFGLAGHLCEMLVEEELSAEIYTKELPILPGAKEVYDIFGKQVLTNQNNYVYVESMGYSAGNTPFYSDLITDATTSGGLLFAVKGWESANEVREAENGAIIGTVIKEVESQQIILSDDYARENITKSLGVFQ